MITQFDVTKVSLETGVTLIEASAGTGKTYSITGLILRLILEKQLEIREILAVTFTEAATQELRDRVYRRLQAAIDDLRRGASKDDVVSAFLKKGDSSAGIQTLDIALQSFDEAQIFTIHGFCQRMLNDFTFESGARFDTTLVTDPNPLFQEIARDFWRLHFYEARPLLPALAMAWKQSPDAWVDLLERTRRHPDLVILPPAPSKSPEELWQEVEAALTELKSEWNRRAPDLENFLREYRGLSRAKGKFSPNDVTEIMAAIAEALEQSDCPAPEGIAAVKRVSLEAIAAGTNATGTPPVDRFFSLSTEFCRPVEDLFNQLTHEFLQFARDELSARKARTNTVTYDDLIIDLRNALKQEGGQVLARAIGDKYSTALIDEFQDTDPAQYEIFRAIFCSQAHRLFFIGDPKQAVYGFRGADVFTYFKAASLADRRFTLTTSWRSEEPLLAAINGLFTQSSNPFILAQTQYHQVCAPSHPTVERLTGAGDIAALNFRLVSPPDDQPGLNQDSLYELIGHSVSTDIDALHEAGALLGQRRLRYSDMAVLVRSHHQGDKIQGVLHERGIRSIVQSERSVFASDEARQMQQFLQGVIDPRRDSLLKAALATTLLGFDAGRLYALDGDDRERQTWLDHFSEWRQQWVNGCFTAMFRNLLVSQQVRARLIHLPAGERRLTNFLHLAELLHEAESTQSLSPDAVCSWLREQRESERVSEDRFQLRLESDEDAVQIVTIHKAKGLEYPIVLCPFLWLPAEAKGREELVFHDQDDPDQHLTFDLRGRKGGAEKHRNWQSEEVRAEEQRLLYVAVTRAMNRCYVYLPEQGTDKSALEQLFQPESGKSLADRVMAFARSSKSSVAASLAKPRVRKQAPPTELGATTALSSRSFTGNISKIAMTASFTGLNTSSTDLNEAGTEASDSISAIIAPPRAPSDLSIFTFARGRRTGDFFHDVLEQMDFGNLEDLPSLIDDKLRTYGFAETLHRPAINQILRQLTQVQLDAGMSLRDIPAKERLSEVEFSYRLAHLTPASLAAALGKSATLAVDVRTRIGNLRFDPIEGFMNGFIDLLFRFKNRYYLVDWKSNWLGSQPANYGREGVRRAMLEHNYYLQYHLYTLAADLFLERRLPAYDYQTHFGGIYYIFLRGIDPKEPSRGIFRDRPAAETIKSLRTLTS